MKELSKKSSGDGAVKYLFSVKRDDEKYNIEGVFLYLPYRKLNNVICASTQIGCNQGCSFCSSSKLPFIDNLTSKEIDEQLVRIVKDNLPIEKDSIEYALEGIGEPLLNYNNVVNAINCHEKLVNNTNFVISTVGIVPNIYHLSKEKFRYPTKLQISLHFPTNEKRRKFIPIAEKYTIEDTLEAAKEFSLKQKKKVALNYILLEGENDSNEDISDLVSLIDKAIFYLKLSYLNNTSQYHSPSRERFEEIKNMLEKRGIETKIFRSVGVKIFAGCGQLAFQKKLKGGK